MKKIWFLTTLLFWGLLLAGCNTTIVEYLEIDGCTTGNVCEVNVDEPEEFISYYDNWSIREKGIYIDEMKQWTWTTYDEEWNVINVEEYKDWKLVNWLVLHVMMNPIIV